MTSFRDSLRQQQRRLRERGPESLWFWDHYDGAAKQVVDAFESVGLSLAGATVADVGCGDGFIDLGVFHKAKPGKLVGFDLNRTNVDYLQRRAGEEGVRAADLDGLEFRQSSAAHIPVADASFDFALSWSAFEHISRPAELLGEIRRILAPHGAFFLQLWPFYFSAKGSHLWEWFPEDHHHLQTPECEIVQDLEGSQMKPPDWTQMMSREFQHLNRITVDELQRCMLAAGFVVRRVEFLTNPVVIRPELARYSWLDLGIGGIKLIATPQ